MSPNLTILYATMTGNAESLAQRAYERALNEGWSAQLQNAAECRASDLADTALLLCIVSTWGDGEPPDDAVDFFAELQAANAPSLTRTRFAVLGLGDRDYAEFNAFARNLDERLSALGGQRMHERIEADVQFDDTYDEWESRVFPLLAGLREATTAKIT